MRRKRNPQLEIFHTMPRAQIGQELAAMSLILDESPAILELVYRDLVGAHSTETRPQRYERRANSALRRSKTVHLVN